jgi:hypothetical protein
MRSRVELARHLLDHAYRTVDDNFAGLTVQVGGAGLFPCAGVYAVVNAPGTMRTGDDVALV